MPLTTTSLFCSLPDDLYDWLDDTAAVRGLTKQALILVAVREYLERYGVRPPITTRAPEETA